MAYKASLIWDHFGGNDPETAMVFCMFPAKVVNVAPKLIHLAMMIIG